ncbi:interferon-induced protein 44-like [Salmo trutta]|uniref:interferon-induced protein 44-like n=1 Tax=Salmo trutta TaxID=8032 RepID=UPI0011305BD0|nr:interferon-induced protein 44-like [Salmo trutta]
MFIITRVDEACPSVKKDLNNIYLSKYIKEKMEQCSAKLGVPVNCILPVKNYHEEIDLNEDMDVLLLRVMRQRVDFADDFIRKPPQDIQLCSTPLKGRRIQDRDRSKSSQSRPRPEGGENESRPRSGGV